MKGERVIPEILLTTNDEGLVNLGHMEKVSILSVKLAADTNITAKWTLLSFHPVQQYPVQLRLCEEDSFRLPLRRRVDPRQPLSVTEAEWQIVQLTGEYYQQESMDLNMSQILKCYS